MCPCHVSLQTAQPYVATLAEFWIIHMGVTASQQETKTFITYPGKIATLLWLDNRLDIPCGVGAHFAARDTSSGLPSSQAATSF